MKKIFCLIIILLILLPMSAHAGMWGDRWNTSNTGSGASYDDTALVNSLAGKASLISPVVGSDNTTRDRRLEGITSALSLKASLTSPVLGTDNVTRDKRLLVIADTDNQTLINRLAAAAAAGKASLTDPLAGLDNATKGKRQLSIADTYINNLIAAGITGKASLTSPVAGTDNVTRDKRILSLSGSFIKPQTVYVPCSQVNYPLDAYPSTGPAVTSTGLYGMGCSTGFMIRQKGKVAYFKAYINKYTPLVHTGLNFEVWSLPKHNMFADPPDNYPPGWTRQVSTGNVLSQITDNNTVTIFYNDNDTVVNPSDMIGFSVTIDHTTSRNLLGGWVDPSINQIILMTTPCTPYSDCDWTEVGNYATSKPIAVQAYMLNPHYVITGDSIGAGYPDFQTGFYVDSYNSPTQQFMNDDPASRIRSALKPYYGELAYQNSSILGDNSTGLLRRFKTDVLDLHPSSFVVINIGYNDFNAGLTVATFKANVTNMVQQLIACDVVPVLVNVIPVTVGADHTRWAYIDSQNAAILQIAAAYPQVIPVNVHDAMGQFHDGGTANNLWEAQAGMLNEDNVHPSFEVGYPLIARLTAAAIIARQGF